MTTDIIYHRIFALHRMSAGHPECPERVKMAMAEIRRSDVLADESARVIEARPAPLSEIEAIHDRSYLSTIQQMSEQGGGFFTLDTSVNEFTYKAALLAAGGGILAVDRVLQGVSRNAFVLCRPPGHHAERSRAFGFCFINNVAVAANHLLSRRGLDRVAIIDYDAHHGNWTQDTFYSSNRVLYVGLHQDGRTLFPGSGFVDETGVGKGVGYTVNIPMYPGAGKSSYRLAFEEVVLPVIDSFKPQFILASAGFDCHHSDPLTNLGLTLQDIARMNAHLLDMARDYSEDNLVLFLEGGYNLEVVALASRVLVEQLAGAHPNVPSETSRESKICFDNVRATVDELKRNLGLT